MKDIDKKDIRELLAEAKKFCNNINRYVKALGLTKREVETFIVDVELLRYIVDNDQSFTENFICYNAISIQSRLTDLIVECTLSENYTLEMGKELGIEIPLSNTRGLKADMNLKWSAELNNAGDLYGTKVAIK
jgi:hypothetical protein